MSAQARLAIALALGIGGIALWLAARPAASPALRARPEPPPRGPSLLVAASVDTDGGQRARIERWRWTNDGVVVEPIEDPRSNVFHVARCDPEVPGAILAASGGEAALTRWRSVGGGRYRSEDLWRTTFGPVSSRMRDAELVRGAALGRDPSWLLAVGTHDQGVVALVTLDVPTRIVELDRRPSTLVHEIEHGDRDGDGREEIYATISPPNTLLPGASQPGAIVRYDPAHDLAPELFADLAPRHAKEILVTDLDGDGQDELYAVVEALLRWAADGEPGIEEPVAIRRLSADGTSVTITTLPDRQTRFLAAGDLDGDGRRELVAAAFSTGLFRIALDEQGG